GGMPMSRFKGMAPMSPALAKVMPESPALMESLVAEFAPIAAQLPDQEIYWLACNGWMTDHVSGLIMDGKVDGGTVAAHAWAIYASSVWGGVELGHLRQKWDSAPAMQSAMLQQMAARLAKGQEDLAGKMSERLDALAAGPRRCLELLPSLLREQTTTGPVHGMAYNAGVQVVKTEDPPVGRRRPQRPAKPSSVRINVRDFMRVDYDLPVPQYLKVWRSKFEGAVTGNPDAYEKIIKGEPGEENLRDLWKRAVLLGLTTWGGESNDKWSDAYFFGALHWSSVLNFGLEAMGLATFVALINQDPEAARRAVLVNTAYLGATPGWGMGMMDKTAKLPAVA
ncbi:MAG: hypothetical protein JWQ29_1477, partial [Phenylobacterium sp.]|nr:hypothetical protein [Phenylobacterium sp.]